MSLGHNWGGTGSGLGGQPARQRFNFPMPGMPQQQQGGGGGQAMPTFTNTATRDPNLDQTYGDVRAYQQALGRNQDASAVAAMGRQRDLISGMSNEFMGGAAGRGTFGTGAAALGQTRILNQGQRSLAETNSRLADSARSQQLGALNTQLGAANAGATNLLGQQNYNLSQWTAQNAAHNNAAQLQAMQNNNQFNQMMQLMQMYTG
jgi:hypothetical protein